MFQLSGAMTGRRRARLLKWVGLGTLACLGIHGAVRIYWGPLSTPRPRVRIQEKLDAMATCTVGDYYGDALGSMVAAGAGPGALLPREAEWASPTSTTMDWVRRNDACIAAIREAHAAPPCAFRILLRDPYAFTLDDSDLAPGSSSWVRQARGLADVCLARSHIHLAAGMPSESYSDALLVLEVVERVHQQPWIGLRCYAFARQGKAYDQILRIWQRDPTTIASFNPSQVAPLGRAPSLSSAALLLRLAAVSLLQCCFEAEEDGGRLCTSVLRTDGPWRNPYVDDTRTRLAMGVFALRGPTATMFRERLIGPLKELQGILQEGSTSARNIRIRRRLLDMERFRKYIDRRLVHYLSDLSVLTLSQYMLWHGALEDAQRAQTLRLALLAVAHAHREGWPKSRRLRDIPAWEAHWDEVQTGYYGAWPMKLVDTPDGVELWCEPSHDWEAPEYPAPAPFRIWPPAAPR